MPYESHHLAQPPTRDQVDRLRGVEVCLIDLIPRMGIALEPDPHWIDQFVELGLALGVPLRDGFCRPEVFVVEYTRVNRSVQRGNRSSLDPPLHLADRRDE